MGFFNIDNTIRKFLPKFQRTQEPLELFIDIENELEKKIIDDLIKGGRKFPYNYVQIEIYSSSEDEKESYQDFINQNLSIRFRDFLQSKCQIDNKLKVDIAIVETSGKEKSSKYFLIKCTTVKKECAPIPEIEITIMKGKAERDRYVFNSTKSKTEEDIYVFHSTNGITLINIGRFYEVFDAEGILVRRNDIVFLDGEPINETVGRLHAQMKFDSEEGKFRLYDNNSARGTLIIRKDKRIKVAGNAGTKLCSGDEIYFGEACVWFQEKNQID